MPFLSWIKRHLPESFLVVIVFFLCFKNFTPGTYLIGWDNLIPELNIWLNLKRSFFAVWQQYQGLGLVGGMGHATDLIRQLIILPFTLVLPTNFIRYFWHFTMLFLGTFGIYFGLKNQLKFSRWIAFCSSLFYLLNFGSVQNFWVPYEAFSTFWGFFPWLIFSLWQYLGHPTRKNLLPLIVFNLLAIPSFYIPTIFVVYFICIFLIFLSYLIINHQNYFKKHFLVQVKTILIILILNSFWLIPFVYFLKTSAQNPRLAVGNLMANEETFNRNQRRGYLADFALLRGYYYDLPSNNTVIMAPWANHLANSYVLICGYMLALFVLIGLIKIFISKKNPVSISLILIFFLSAIALLSATPPFQQINSLIRQIGFLDQVFRSPWTKFIVPAIFIFTLLTAYGLQTVIDIFTKLKYSQKFSSFICFFYLSLLLIFSFPVFTGNYFSPQVRQKIPSSYFQLFNYFQQQSPTARIMNLPQGSFYGWTDYLWGVSGSGFLWYAMPQPILDRAFDVWQLNNQNYYFELSTALQQRNSLALQAVLEKYSVEYVIFDSSVYFPDDKIYGKLSLSTNDLLKQIPDLNLVNQFGSISVYHFQQKTSPYLSSNLSDLSSLSSTSSYQTIKPDLSQISTPILPSSHNDLAYPKSQQITNSSSTFFRLQTTLDNQLLAFNFPSVTFDHSYLLHLKSRNLSGRSLTISAFDDQGLYKFFLTNLDKTKDWTDSWYLIPKMESYPFDSGLTVLFNNSSFNYFPSQNDISEIELYSYPSSPKTYLQTLSPTSRTPLTSSDHLFYSQIFLPSQKSPTYLVFPQTYSPDWLAFYFQNHQLKFLTNHHIANNWANSWSVPQNTSTTIYLLFWPQLLEFIGFALIPLVLLFIKKRR